MAWHLADPPRTETALAAALPLAGLDAWRIYLGLPMHSSRSIDRAEYLRLAYEDAVVNHFGPITAQARRRVPGRIRRTGRPVRVRRGPLALLGGSLGSAVAQLVAMDRDDVAAEVLVSPVTRLRAAVAATSAASTSPTPGTRAADEIADELDFVARADETASTAPAVRLIVGERDDAPSTTRPSSCRRRWPSGTPIRRAPTS